MPENLNNSLKQLPVIVIVGPTAVGKTEVSVQLAKVLQAEIISADSRQIYKLMHIGTAKPTSKERQDITHHFMDYIAPDETFSSGAFGNNARDVILELRKAEKNVLVVGGSGLYIRALLYGMISFDQKDGAIRKKLNGQLQQKGLAYLYKELQNVDPVLAAQLSENDTQRILRGLEVYQMSGETLSSLQKEKETAAPFPFIQIGLTMDRAQLYQRINARVDKMLEQGLIDEVKDLLQRGYGQSNAINAVGYKEVVSYLKQEISYLQMLELIQRNSRRYAKRQFTWFRKDENIHWFEMPDAAIVKRILDSL